MRADHQKLCLSDRGWRCLCDEGGHEHFEYFIFEAKADVVRVVVISNF